MKLLSLVIHDRQDIVIVENKTGNLKAKVVRTDSGIDQSRSVDIKNWIDPWIMNLAIQEMLESRKGEGEEKYYEFAEETGKLLKISADIRLIHREKS